MILIMGSKFLTVAYIIGLIIILYWLFTAKKGTEKKKSAIFGLILYLFFLIVSIIRY